MARRGIMKTSYHIDRIDETKGCVPGNIQCVTNTQNMKKYLRYSHDKNGKPTEYRFATTSPMNDNDYPF